jgi:SAM-dependent methyltransferase
MIDYSNQCPNCGASSKHLFLHAKDRHYGNSGEFQISRCTVCTLAFLDPMPSNELLASYYPSSFYAYQEYKKPGKVYKFIKSMLLMDFPTKDPSFDFPGTILDIGCGSGEFIYEWSQKGWKVYGVEPSKQATDYGRSIRGLDITNGTLLEAKYHEAQFDYIRSNHSFEHINNPNETLDEIYRILKVNGKLLIGVPNIDGIFAKIFGTYWWYLGAPVHTFNYSTKTLSQLALKHGFSVDRVVHNGNFTGLLGSIQIWINRSNGKSSQEGYFFNFKPLRILCQWIAKFTNIFQISDAIEITFVKKK